MAGAVHAVLLAWQEAPQAVAARLAPLAGQLQGLVVVDNSTATTGERWSVLEAVAPCTVILNGGNAGVAAGFNRGIEAAIGAGAALVLLLDEDSEPEAGMLPALMEAWSSLSRGGSRVAAVGPDFVDAASGRRALFPRIDGWRLQHRSCSGCELIPSDFLMSSGALIDAAAFRAVGPLDERLFVDYVDTEWCLRARAQGYGCHAVCGARMQHRFGAGPWLRLPGGRTLAERAPFRSYYAARNALLMINRSYCPWRWKLNALKRVYAVTLLQVLTWRRAHLRMTLLGLLHGMLGRTGPGPVSEP